MVIILMPAASKTFLVVKDEYKDEAKIIFGDTTISQLPHAVKDILELLLGQETSPPNMSVAKLKSGARS